MDKHVGKQSESTTRMNELGGEIDLTGELHQLCHTWCLLDPSVVAPCAGFADTYDPISFTGNRMKPRHSTGIPLGRWEMNIEHVVDDDDEEEEDDDDEEEEEETKINIVLMIIRCMNMIMIAILTMMIVISVLDMA